MSCHLPRGVLAVVVWCQLSDILDVCGKWAQGGRMSLLPMVLSSFCPRLGHVASTAGSYQVCTPSAWCGWMKTPWS